MRSGDSTAQEVPPELAGLLHQFDQIEGAVARASAAAMLSQSMALLLAVAACGGSEAGSCGRPALDAEQRAVLDLLADEGVMASADLAERVGCSANSIKNWCGPDGVLREYGVEPVPNKGYGIRPA